MDKIRLLEMKLILQEEYVTALETNNINKATFLRGKLSLLEELLTELKTNGN